MNNKKYSLIEIVLQLLVIFVSVYVGYNFSLTHDIIPKSVIRLPDVHVSTSDMWHVSKIFIVIFAVFLVPVQYFLGNGVFYRLKRFLSEYLVYLCAYTTASMYVFLATTINYDPQLIAAIGLFSTIIYFIIFAVWYAFDDANKYRFGGFFLALFAVIKGLVSIKGILVLIYFVSPLLLGKAFVSDRDTANLITQVRIWFNPIEDTDWGLNKLYSNIKFSQPVLVKQPPLNINELYVLERNGRIYKLDYPSSEESELVLDIFDTLGEVEVENGALGFDFHPEFGEEGSINKDFIYIYYTEKRKDKQVNWLMRFDISRADMQSRLNTGMVLLSLDRNADGFHNGGSVEFGPDGYLYIAIGEGVHPKGVTRYSEVLRSGILRIDVDLANTQNSFLPTMPFSYGSRQNYLIPNDNPFVGNPDIMDEYWAIGLRNPFRFTFDAETGQIWAGDVGSAVWEEINIIEKGKHYQFPFFEGVTPTGKGKKEQVTVPEQGPVYTYQHTAYDRAVIGGVVYRGKKFPDLYGKYIFADNYSAKIFKLDNARETVDVQLIAQGKQYAQRGASSVVQLKTGDILVTLLGAASEPSGEILSLVKSADVEEQQASEKDNNSNSDTPLAYDADITRQLFAVNCSRCHGPEGRGDGPEATSMDVVLPDFTSKVFQSSRTDQKIRDVIEKGGAKMQMSPMMPPWGGFLKNVEIDHLTTYTRALGAVKD